MSEEATRKIIHVHLSKDETFKTTLSAANHHLIADEPEDVEGGTDQGPDPYDYLLMALGSCSVMTVKMYAKQKGWPVEDIYAEIRHHHSHAEDCKSCESSDSRIDLIEKELIVKGDLNKKQIKRLLEISNKCPVHRTLQSDISIESTINI
ncbi:MAG: OsmC family protein [Balneolaceae bacterium]